MGLFHVHTYFFRSLPNAGPIGDRDHFIQSALIVPTGFLGQYYYESYEDEYLIVVTSDRQESIFIGHITDDPTKNEDLLLNLQERKKGKTLNLGMFANIDHLKLSEEKYIDQYGSSYSHRVSEVTKDIYFLRDQEQIEQESNTYITSLPDIETVGAGFAAINLDPDKIIVDYFALYIEENLKNWKEFVPPSERDDNDIGNLALAFRDYETWLGSCRTLTDVVHRILNTWILVPDISTQREVIRIARKIDNMAEYLTHLRGKLWGETEEFQIIDSEIDAIGEQDSFAVWLGKLPIPLSTILWSYHTNTNTQEKVEDLFFFIEAAAQLFSLLLLSILASDRDYYLSHQVEIFRGVQKEKFQTATLGSWNFLGSQLARFFKRELETKSDNRLNRMVRQIDTLAIETLSDSTLWGILQEANGLRNSWKGHTGKVNQTEQSDRLERLENIVQRFRNLVAGRIDPIRFIVRNEEESFKGGYHTYRIEYFEGYATPLKRGVLKTKTPLETECLYLIGSDSERPIKILPIVKLVRESGGKTIAYFYNRMKEGSDSFRFVTYQDAERSEMEFSSDEVGSDFDVLISPGVEPEYPN